MKKNFIIITVVSAVIFGSCMTTEQWNMMTFMMKSGNDYDTYQEFQVIERNDAAPAPTAFEPFTAKTTEGDYNRNITVISQNAYNEESPMLKKATVQPNGAGDYTGWQLLADEGFDEGKNTFGPSPLSYLTSGAAANLHTQLLRAAEVLDVKLDNVKVEVLDKFHWENMLKPEGAGFLGETHTNIIIESSESEETIRHLIEIAMNAWTAGEAFGNATTIEPVLVVNGKNWESNRTIPATSLSDVSVTDGLKLTEIIDAPMKSEYFAQISEEDRDMSFDAMSNLFFEILAVSESAEDPDNPYLKKVTVSFNTSESETWVIYSDELNGTGGIPEAPTSLEYLTVGTALCLTSQLTLVSATLNLDFTDFRVEQQIDYREENVNSPEMAGYADTVHTYVLVESDESEEKLETFYQKALALCFAGEAFKGATDMYTHSYLNGEELK